MCKTQLSGVSGGHRSSWAWQHPHWSPIVLPLRQMLSSTQIECFGWALGGIVHLEVSTSKLEPTEVLWIALHHASKHSPMVPVRLDRMSKATQSQGLEHSEAKAPRWLRHTARFTKNALFVPWHHSRVTLGYKSQIQGMALPVSAPRQDLAAGPIKAQSGYCLQTFSFRISAVGLTAKRHIWALYSKKKYSLMIQDTLWDMGSKPFKDTTLLFSEMLLADCSFLKENSKNNNVLYILLLLIFDILFN